MLLYLGKNCSNFSWKDFRSVVKNVFCVSVKTNSEKICFFIIFGHCAISLPLLNFFMQIRQNCIPNVGMHFEQKFFWKTFFVTFGHWNKRFWYFVEDFRAGLSNCILRVQWSFLCEKKFFGKKGKFFSVNFGYWAKFFWAYFKNFSAGSTKMHHKCQLQFREKIFDLETFCWVSDLERISLRLFFETFQAWSSKLYSMCPQEFFEKEFFWTNTFFNLFGKWAMFLHPPTKNFQQEVTIAFHVTMGTVWWSFLFEKFFLYDFWTLSNNVPAFCQKFLVTAVRTAFHLFKGPFWGNCFVEKIYFSFFLQWAKKFRNFVP